MPFSAFKNAITFPFIDIKDRIRVIQVKQFNENNQTIGTHFLHSIIEKHYPKNKKRLPDWIEQYKNNDLKVSCLFGEHLLNHIYPLNPLIFSIIINRCNFQRRDNLPIFWHLTR